MWCRFARSFATLLHVLAEDTKAATPHVATALKLVELVLGVVAAEADAKVLLFALIALGQLVCLRCVCGRVCVAVRVFSLTLLWYRRGFLTQLLRLLLHVAMCSPPRQ